MSCGAGTEVACRFQLSTFKARLQTSNERDIGTSSIACLCHFTMSISVSRHSRIRSRVSAYSTSLYFALLLALSLIQFSPSSDGFLICLSLLYLP